MKLLITQFSPFSFPTLCSCFPWHTVNTPSQSSLNVRPSFTSKCKTTGKMTDFYIFTFSMAMRESFPRGKVTRTCGSIYCQGEERVELTFNFPICLHGSHTKFNFTSAITTFKLEMGRQHILINGTKQSLDLFCS